MPLNKINEIHQEKNGKLIIIKDEKVFMTLLYTNINYPSNYFFFFPNFASYIIEVKYLT